MTSKSFFRGRKNLFFRLCSLLIQSIANEKRERERSLVWCLKDQYDAMRYMKEEEEKKGIEMKYRQKMMDIHWEKKERRNVRKVNQLVWLVLHIMSMMRSFIYCLEKSDNEWHTSLEEILNRCSWRSNWTYFLVQFCSSLRWSKSIDRFQWKSDEKRSFTCDINPIR